MATEGQIVARIYAGILGPLALLTSLARDAIHGGGAEAALWRSWCSLLAFAAVGYAIGWVGQRIVTDSVRSRIAAELAARKASEAPEPAVADAARG